MESSRQKKLQVKVEYLRNAKDGATGKKLNRYETDQ
jgi:hypothetical protein